MEFNNPIIPIQIPIQHLVGNVVKFNLMMRVNPYSKKKKNSDITF